VVFSEFWDGETGLALGALGRDAQLTAMYLLTAPTSHMTGLYKLPLSAVIEHLGLTMDPAAALNQVLSDMRNLEKIGFAHYDADSKVVFIPNMARFQLGKKLSAGDKRVFMIRTHLMTFLSSPFIGAFLDAYEEAFNLQDVRKALDMRVPMPLRRGMVRGFEGASKSEVERATVTEPVAVTTTATDQDPAVLSSSQESAEPASLKPDKQHPWDALSYVMALDEETGVGNFTTLIARDVVYWHTVKSTSPYWQSRHADISSHVRLATALPLMQRQMEIETPHYEYPANAFDREQVPDPDCKLCAGVGSTCEDDPDPRYPAAMMLQTQRMCSCLVPGRFNWEFAERAEKRAA
jgi:hypothetical protein